MERLSSRKLAGLIVAICGIVGLVLGLAIISPQTITESSEVVLTALIAISGLGGFQVYRQAKVDEHPVWMAGPGEAIKRVG